MRSRSHTTENLIATVQIGVASWMYICLLIDSGFVQSDLYLLNLLVIQCCVQVSVYTSDKEYLLLFKFIGRYSAQYRCLYASIGLYSAK